MERPRRYRRHARIREAAAPRYPSAPQAQDVAGVLLDSDVIIEILRGRAWAVDAATELRSAGARSYYCAISLAEVYAGVRPGEEAVTEAFFSARGDIPIDAAIGRRAGSYLARFSRSHGVEIADALIAAVAASARLPLWTLNRRHYPMPDVTFFEPPRRGR